MNGRFASFFLAFILLTPLPTASQASPCEDWLREMGNMLPTLRKEPSRHFLQVQLSEIPPLKLLSSVLSTRQAFKKFEDRLKRHGFLEGVHWSISHSLRDTSVQNLIVTYGLNTRAEREVLGELAVFFAHWLDDFADGPHVEKLSKLSAHEFTSLRYVLNKMDPRFVPLYDELIADAKLRLPSFHEKLFEQGMLNMVRGGQFFSKETKSQHAELRRQFKEHILSGLEPDSDIYKLVRKSDPRIMAYSVKVVSEGWASVLTDEASSDYKRNKLALLKNHFFSAGLVYHDDVSEWRAGEMTNRDLVSVEAHRQELQAIFRYIETLPPQEIKAVLRGADLYVASFHEVLRKSELLTIYKRFLRQAKIREALDH